ncbi:MAG: hypothetical protein RLZZ127_1122 [Planctomycetota bacterium]|jgi:hypothetical protein
MAISSLVLDIDPGPEGDGARAVLAADPRITVGPGRGTRQAVVVETADDQAAIDAFTWLQGLPGVRLATLACAYLDAEPLPAGAAGAFL